MSRKILTVIKIILIVLLYRQNVNKNSKFARYKYGITVKYSDKIQQ